MALLRAARSDRWVTASINRPALGKKLLSYILNYAIIHTHAHTLVHIHTPTHQLKHTHTHTRAQA